MAGQHVGVMKFPPVQPRRVVITGCSTGIGAAAALMMKDAGWDVIPTARKPEDLALLRAQGYEPVSLDVADEDSVSRAAEIVLERSQGEPGALVNNAGYGQPGAVEDQRRAMLRRQFEVNLIGMQDLTNRLLPALRGQGCGRIVNVSSVLGRVSMPFNAPYSASKFAMEALSDGLRVELCDTGVAVSLIEPGAIETAFRDNAVTHAEAELLDGESRFQALYQQDIERRRRRSSTRGDRKRYPPEAVAAKICHALESPRPKRRYCITPEAYVGALAARLLPAAILDAVFIRKFRKAKDNGFR